MFYIFQHQNYQVYIVLHTYMYRHQHRQYYIVRNLEKQLQITLGIILQIYLRPRDITRANMYLPPKLCDQIT